MESSNSQVPYIRMRWECMIETRSSNVLNKEDFYGTNVASINGVMQEGRGFTLDDPAW